MKYHLTSPAAPARVRHAHLTEPAAGAVRRRRRTMQRCSAVVATLFLGAGQCDSPTSTATTSSPTSPAPATAAPTTTPTAAPTTTSTTVDSIVPGPDGTAIAGRCTQFETLLAAHAPAGGWDVPRMSRLAWRESNCWPVIRSRTSDSGLLQINDITLEFLNDELGEVVDRDTLMDPVQNIRAAAALCSFWARNGSSCYQPWTSN